jgi:ATP-dependent Clp endopeptidase proteolytic subunit ClpP
MQLLVSNDELTADLYIMGDIRRGNFWDTLEGDDATDRKTDALDMVRALGDLPNSVGAIDVHINSYGGEVAEGLAVYNALKAHKAKVTTICEGFACSIASVVFMAGDERIMRDSSMLMIHNPSLYAGGTAEDLRKAADDLDVIREASITAYMSHATVERDEIVALMDAETWITPERAIEMGLATASEDDEDEGAPTQSARKRVMQAITGGNVPINVALETCEGFDVEGIAKAIVEQLAPFLSTSPLAGPLQSAAQDADEDEDEVDDPDTDDPDEDPDDKPATQRFARIFQQLAN